MAVLESITINGIEHRAVEGFYPMPPEDAAKFAAGKIVLHSLAIPAAIKRREYPAPGKLFPDQEWG